MIIIIFITRAPLLLLHILVRCSKHKLPENKEKSQKNIFVVLFVLFFLFFCARLACYKMILYTTSRYISNNNPTIIVRFAKANGSGIHFHLIQI